MEQVVSTNVERAVRRFVYIFSTAVWALVGFLYWIPLLARSCGAYSGAVILAIIGRTTPSNKAAKLLDIAAKFYTKGFTDIREAVYGPVLASEIGDREEKPVSIFSSWEEFGRVLVVVGIETTIAVLFWGLILLLISHLFS